MPVKKGDVVSEFDVLLLVLWVITMFGAVLAIGKIQHERKLKKGDKK